jgi:hypothetical protein
MTIVDGCGERGDPKVESCGRRGTGIEVGSLVLFRGNDGLFGVGTWIEYRRGKVEAERSQTKVVRIECYVVLQNVDFLEGLWKDSKHLCNASSAFHDIKPRLGDHQKSGRSEGRYEGTTTLSVRSIIGPPIAMHLTVSNSVVYSFVLIISFS